MTEMGGGWHWNIKCDEMMAIKPEKEMHKFVICIKLQAHPYIYIHKHASKNIVYTLNFGVLSNGK